MLNLNAMFGSCESIFESDAPRKKPAPKVSVTELQMMEMEISADLAKVEADHIKGMATMSQLDQLLNMYNHVKRFGIDRTFLSLYNRNGQLNNMLGMRFPSCESVDSEGYPGSNMSKAFLVAMEDEKEGVFAKIGQGIKWIWEKIVNFFSTVWQKIKSWMGISTKKNEVVLQQAVSKGSKCKAMIVKIGKPILYTWLITMAASILWKGGKVLDGVLKEAIEKRNPDAVSQLKPEETAEAANKAATEGEGGETQLAGDAVAKQAGFWLKCLQIAKKLTGGIDSLEQYVKSHKQTLMGAAKGDKDANGQEIQENSLRFTITEKLGKAVSMALFPTTKILPKIYGLIGDFCTRFSKANGDGQGAETTPPNNNAPEQNTQNGQQPAGSNTEPEAVDTIEADRH
jgi:hypothetical protein